jgi:molybdenum cofactor biosynthesis enzyme MoaA
VERLAKAGLDSLRVSLNSVQEDFYTKYYRPKGYSFADVKASVKTMKDHGKFVSLNYFIQPGITDSHQEFNELCRFIELLGPDLIQLRNLNMDPEWYLRTLGVTGNMEKLGLRRWLAELKAAFPRLRFGYFNPSLDPSCSQ